MGSLRTMKLLLLLGFAAACAGGGDDDTTGTGGNKNGNNGNQANKIVRQLARAAKHSILPSLHLFACVFSSLN